MVNIKTLCTLSAISEELKFIISKTVEPDLAARLTPEQGKEFVEVLMQKRCRKDIPISAANFTSGSTIVPAFSKFASSSNSSMSSKGFSYSEHERFSAAPQSPDTQQQAQPSHNYRRTQSREGRSLSSGGQHHMTFLLIF